MCLAVKKKHVGNSAPHAITDINKTNYLVIIVLMFEGTISASSLLCLRNYSSDLVLKEFHCLQDAFGSLKTETSYINACSLFLV